ncbi:5760_t:CDS:2 [Paraglomus occultum]|uniref:5760_t:CDS:1 n=1 Tax=Paraglomus occultum TaxID=144539 RepID=A0A9N9A6Q1_9GLOM|nr:5760_t:CDS:2 [Paraglomus occultum]
MASQQHQTTPVPITTNRHIISTDRPHSSSTNSTSNKTLKISLEPLNDSVYFATKVLTFGSGQEIRIGRVSGSRNQREARTDNGVFVCDVMSREHALLKEMNGRICIKDLRSTHGTFVNGERVQQEPRYLKHADIITFGHSVRRNQNLYKHLSARVLYPPQEGNQQILPPQHLQGVKRDNANGSENSHVKTNETDHNTKPSKHATDSKSDKERTTNIKLNVTSDRAKEKSPGPSEVHNNLLQIPTLSPERGDGKEPEKPIEETRIEHVEDRKDGHDLESEPPAPQKSDVAFGKSSGGTSEAAEKSKHVSTPNPYASIPIQPYPSSYHTTSSRAENISQQKSQLTLDVDTTLGVSTSDTKSSASKTTSAASSVKNAQPIAQNDEQPVKKIKKSTKGRSRSVKGKKEAKELPTNKTHTSAAATTTPESQDKSSEQSPTPPSPELTPVNAHSSDSNSFPPPVLTPASSTLISMTVPPKSTSKSTQASSSGKRSYSETEQDDVQVLQNKLEDARRRVKRAKVGDFGLAIVSAVTAFIGAGLGVTYLAGQ